MIGFKKYLLLFFFAGIGLLTNAQLINISSKDSIQGEFTTFSVDNLGNIYLSNQDIITKLSPKLDTLFSTSLKSHFPTFIQAVKNFRILTFDQERGVVQFFDNTLTPLTSSLNLYDLDLIQPILVCESFNGNSFWVLDAGTLRLLKVSESFKIIMEVENLSFLTNDTSNPTQMIEHNDLLYIITAHEGVMVFDAFGTFIKKMTTKSFWMSFYKNAILQYIYPSFVFVDVMNDESKFACNWLLPNIKSFQITNKFLYALTSSGFIRGVINQPPPAKNK